MLLRPVSHPEARPRFLLNGFPKAGLHLLALLVAPIADPPDGTLWEHGDWWGVLYNIWTLKWRDERALRGQFWKLARLQPGEYLRGHIAHREDVAAHIDNCGIAHVFIRRDLRDVAVSLAHHVLDPTADAKHTGKSLFMLMDDFDDVLEAAITGVGPYAGVVERWQQYRGWLDAPRTLCIRYEDALTDRESAAETILRYGLERIRDVFDVDWMIDPRRFAEGVAAMVKTSFETHRSPTFRTGTAGGWREMFKTRHHEAFKRAGGLEALDAMGYEED